MQYTAYIYRGLFESEPIDQIEEINSIEIEEHVETFSTLSFIVNYYREADGQINTKNLKEFRRIKIVEESTTEKIIFDAVIFELVPNFNGVQVVCRDYRGFLESKRYLTENKNYSNQTAGFIINDLITGLNAKTTTDPYPENWDFELDEPEALGSLEFKKGNSYYSIFKRVALEFDKNFFIKEDGIIQIKSIVGEDKTEGLKFTELLYNNNEIAQNNIAKIPGVVKQETIINSLITDTTIENNSESIEDYIRLESYENLTGDEVINFLSKSSKPQVIYTLDVKFWELDHPIEIGDKVAVRIESGIIHLDIEGEVFVTRKKSRIKGNRIETLEIDVSEIVISQNTFLKKFKDVRQEIKNLKIT